MKKSITVAALLASALLSFNSAQAAYEVRSSFADENGVILVELVDSETQEVVDTRTFQSRDVGPARADVADSVVTSEEDTHTVEAGDTDSAIPVDVPAGDVDTDVVDISGDSTDVDTVSGDAVDVQSNQQEEVDGVWKKVVAALSTAAAYLEQQAAALEAKAASVFHSEDAAVSNTDGVTSEAPVVEAVDVPTEATAITPVTEPAEVQPVK